MTSHKLVEYLKTHDLISINRLEAKLHIPQSTVWKAVHGEEGSKRNIPKKWIEPIANELKEYGLKIK